LRINKNKLKKSKERSVRPKERVRESPTSAAQRTRRHAGEIEISIFLLEIFDYFFDFFVFLVYYFHTFTKLALFFQSFLSFKFRCFSKLVFKAVFQSLLVANVFLSKFSTEEIPYSKLGTIFLTQFFLTKKISVKKFRVKNFRIKKFVL